LAVLKSASQLPLERWLTAEKAPEGCREARLFFEELIETHIERKLVTRPLLAEEA
jgi:hypothetical protein